MFQLSVVLLSILNLVWPSGEPPVSDRWHEWPVTRVFPDTMPGSSPSGARVTYVLAGIAPEAPCAVALQPAALRALPGCRTALRATYTDSTQTFVATVGVAVLDGAGARTALAKLPRTDPVRPVLAGNGWPVRAADGRPPSVRPVAFPGGAAERFGEAQYITGAIFAAADRYVVLAAAGYADGRAYQRGVPPTARLSGVARQLASGLHRVLTR